MACVTDSIESRNSERHGSSCRIQNLYLSYSGCLLQSACHPYLDIRIKQITIVSAIFCNEIHVNNVLSSCKFQVKHSLLRRRVWLTKLVKIRSQTKRITSAYLLRHVTCSFREFSERINISWITTATVKGKRKYKFFGVT